MNPMTKISPRVKKIFVACENFKITDKAPRNLIDSDDLPEYMGVGDVEDVSLKFLHTPLTAHNGIIQSKTTCIKKLYELGKNLIGIMQI